MEPSKKVLFGGGGVRAQIDRENHAVIVESGSEGAEEIFWGSTAVKKVFTPSRTSDDFWTASFY